MKTVLLGGALAFALWGGAALANDQTAKDCATIGSSDQSLSTTGSASVDTGSDTGVTMQQQDLKAEDQDLGTGGSSEEGISSDQKSMNDCGNYQQSQPEAQPYGGSGDVGLNQQSQQPADRTTIINVEPQPTDDANALAMQDERDRKDQDKVTKDSDMRGVSVTVGGGVEGYTGGLAPMIQPGPSWGVSVGLRPSKVLGLELGYTGAVNNIDAGGVTGNGADIVRNGGSAVATVGLTAAPVQPYVLGGVGIDRYNVRHDDNGEFRDDTVGNVPLGLGLRTHVSKFTADLRGTYGVMFNQDFARGEGNTNLADIGSSTPTGRLGARLRLGSTF